MAKVVAIDAGTTGVRALVVDERARVADVAYRELTQHFPRPGWVEHDPAEIWDAVRATLAEVGGRLAQAGDAVAAIGITNQRETLVAFDRSTGQPLHRAIVWQDRRTAALCAELTGAGHLPLVRETTGLVLDPYFSATKAAWLLRSGELPLAAGDASLSFCTVDTWVLWNLTGGPSGGAYATDPSNASRTLLLDTATLAWSPELCDLFGVPVHTLPDVRPSAGRFGAAALADLGPASAVLDGVPVSGVLGDQQAALFGQACFDPGMVKVTYGTGSFALANAGPERPPAPDGLTVSCAWDLGDARGRVTRPRRLRARRLGLRLRRGDPVAARRARHHRRRRRHRPARGVGPRQRRRHLRAGPHRTRQPLVGPDRPRHRDRVSPAARDGPRSRGPAWKGWRSRCAT